MSLEVLNAHMPYSDRFDVLKNTKVAHVNLYFWASSAHAHMSSTKVPGSGALGLDLFMRLYVRTVSRNAKGQLDDTALFNGFIADGIDPEEVLDAFLYLLSDVGRDDMIGPDLERTLSALNYFISSGCDAFRNALSTVPVLESVAASLRRQKQHYQDEVGHDNIQIWVGASTILR